MKNGEPIELFGPMWPDRQRLAADAGLPDATVDEFVTELQFVVKTLTRLGWLVDLFTDIGEAMESDEEDPLHVIGPGGSVLGHPNVMGYPEGRVCNAFDLVLVLNDRLRLGADASELVPFMRALGTQYREVSGTEQGVTTAMQDLGLEAMVEQAIHDAPEPLRHHGYEIVSMQRQVRLANGKRPDIIAEMADGSTMVIELKRLDATLMAIEQCAGYIDQLRAEGNTGPLRGLVIGDGIDEVDDTVGPGYDRNDIDVLPLRALDLPSARAQRWMWWPSLPSKPSQRPHAVVAVAADGVTPVAAWPIGDAANPVEIGTRRGWPPDAGWCCPVPLNWDRDYRKWRTDDRTELVRRRLEAERAGVAGWPTPGDLWEKMNGQPRHPASDLTRTDVPESVGVYAWYHEGEAVYSGRAVGKGGLRDRVWGNHLQTGPDLSRSSFRRNVCEHLGIAPTSKTKVRPTLMTAEDVKPVNDWIRSCEVAWITCDTAHEAVAIEKAIHAEWMPPLSRR